MKDKVKIVHVVEAFGGGVFGVLIDLLNGTSDDFDITVLYSPREQTPENFKEYYNNNIKFIEIKNFTRNISPIKDLKAYIEVKRHIKEIKPDIVHLHSSKAGIIGRLAISAKKTKMFYNPHGFSFLKEDDSKLKRFVYRAIEKIATIRKCTIIGCSEGEYKEALKLSKNSICINNGINIDKIGNEVKDLQQKELDLTNLKICTSGRIGYQKNPKGFNEIAKAFPDINFTWIGDGELREELTASNITITGWKTRAEVLKELSKNDVFILASLWEGLPISLLEAMYMKKICIVSNVIGNRDVIENGENGFIADNTENHIKVIDGISENQIDTQRIITSAYTNILEEYNTEKMCNKYVKLYSAK